MSSDGHDQLGPLLSVDGKPYFRISLRHLFLPILSADSDPANSSLDVS
jgi:hypothetical protein